MKLAIISFAREGSKRLPKKNTMLLNGKPLIWYTLQTMKHLLWLRDICIASENMECYVLTDSKECEKICKKEEKNGITILLFIKIIIFIFISIYS